jgi:hypothetical protein
MDGSQGAVRDEQTLSGLRNLDSDGSSHVRIGHAARACSLISPPGTPPPLDSSADWQASQVPRVWRYEFTGS